jgi:hypothetical protein
VIGRGGLARVRAQTETPAGPLALELLSDGCGTATVTRHAGPKESPARPRARAWDLGVWQAPTPARRGQARALLGRLDRVLVSGAASLPLGSQWQLRGQRARRSHQVTSGPPAARDWEILAPGRRLSSGLLPACWRRRRARRQPHRVSRSLGQGGGAEEQTLNPVV